jgi:hypothetical protein
VVAFCRGGDSRGASLVRDRPYVLTPRRYQKGERMLSRPTFAIWLISTVIAVIVILMTYAGVSIPVISPILAGHGFEALLIAYVLLWLGTVFTGL